MGLDTSYVHTSVHTAHGPGTLPRDRGSQAPTGVLVFALSLCAGFDCSVQVQLAPTDQKSVSPLGASAHLLAHPFHAGLTL